MSTLPMIVSVLPLFVNAARLPTVSSDAGRLAGVWKGTSVCQIKDSPCHDEVSVYYVTEDPEHEIFHIKMNKVVNGAEQRMGTIDCKARAEIGSLDCRPNDFTMWTWQLDQDVLNGTLQYRGHLYRKIRLTRAK